MVLIEDIAYDIMDSIRDSLTPELLKPEYVDDNKENPMFGHCYISSEALYYKLKEYHKTRFKAVCGKDDEGITHWWIVDTQTGRRFDVTADQYYSIGKTPPYENGTITGFLTNKPSKRCQVLLNKMES